MQRDGSGNGRYSPHVQDAGRDAVRQMRPNPDFSDQARERAMRRRKHRKHVLTAFYLCLFFAVLGTAAVLSLTVLFKITDISVAGTSRYQQQQIIAASGIKTGDNLFLVRTKEDAVKIRRALPYLGSVKISRKIPSGISIEIREASPAGAAAYGSGFAVIGEDGNVLESAPRAPDGCMTIQGLKISRAQPGMPMQLSDSKQESILQGTLSAVEASGLGKITSADFSQPSRILLVYDKRVTINLGTAAELGYKLKFAKELLKSNIKATESGTLNMSTAADTDKAYFDPGCGAPSSAAPKK